MRASCHTGMNRPSGSLRQAVAQSSLVVAEGVSALQLVS